jgi:hypothetical protein
MRLIAAALLLPALTACNRPFFQQQGSAELIAPVATESTVATSEPAGTYPGFIYGRVTATDEVIYEGRLRWGGDQEAFWTDFFNGTKADNPWADYAPGGRNRGGIAIFGIQLGGGPSPLRRLFMAPFGAMSRIERHFRDVKVTLKSGTVVTLDRFAAGDIDDGVRVWDATRGVVDLDSGQIKSIEFLAGPEHRGAERRLYGKVRTGVGEFVGLIAWDQQEGLTSDTLDGNAQDGPARIRYGAIRSIARRSPSSAGVVLLDGREVVLSGDRDVSSGNLGIYVDDRRYGRVLISWNAFERADFTAGDRPPAFDDFPAGRPLHATVTTRDGSRMSGRLVYDFDESETTDTLDGALKGVDFNVPFALIASVVPGGATGEASLPVVTLHDGQQLSLERSGDLGDHHPGLLIFVDPEHSQYVAWPDVARIDFTR